MKTSGIILAAAAAVANAHYDDVSIHPSVSSTLHILTYMA